MGPMPSWRAMSLSFWPGMAWEDLTSPLGSRHVIVRIVFVATPFFSPSESSLANAAARPSNMPMRTSLCRQARHPKPGLGGVSSAAAPTVRRCKTMQTRRNSCMRRFDEMSKQDTKGEENGRDRVESIYLISIYLSASRVACATQQSNLIKSGEKCFCFEDDDPYRGRACI